MVGRYSRCRGHSPTLRRRRGSRQLAANRFSAQPGEDRAVRAQGPRAALRAVATLHRSPAIGIRFAGTGRGRLRRSQVTRLRIAVVTRYFPSSAEPWQGRSAYQTLRVLARDANVQVFFPNAAYPSWFRPRSRVYDQLDASYSPPDVKATYYDYPALPLVSRPFNGRMAARVLLPHVRSFAPDLIFSFVLYPYGYAALQIGKALSVPVVAMGIGSDVHSIGDRLSAMRTRSVLREADFLVTVSEDLRKKAVGMGRS